MEEGDREEGGKGKWTRKNSSVKLYIFLRGSLCKKFVAVRQLLPKMPTADS